MGPHTVIEVNSWNVEGHEYPDFDILKDDDYTGVVLKVSQGMQWSAPYGPACARFATRAGLLLGALHYADLRHDDPAEQAIMCLGSLPPADWPLGIILEVGELSGKDAFPAGEWIKTWCGTAEGQGLDVALILPDRLLDDSPTAPYGRRLIDSFDTQKRPESWAHLFDYTTPPQGVHGPTRGYRLTSLRGLNAPGMATTAALDNGDDDPEDEEAEPSPPATPTAPEAPPSVPLPPDEELEARGDEWMTHGVPSAT